MLQNKSSENADASKSATNDISPDSKEFVESERSSCSSNHLKFGRYSQSRAHSLVTPVLDDINDSKNNLNTAILPTSSKADGGFNENDSVDNIPKFSPLLKKRSKPADIARSHQASSTSRFSYETSASSNGYSSGSEENSGTVIGPYRPAVWTKSMSKTAPLNYHQQSLPFRSSVAQDSTFPDGTKDNPIHLLEATEDTRSSFRRFYAWMKTLALPIILLEEPPTWGTVNYNPSDRTSKASSEQVTTFSDDQLHRSIGTNGRSSGATSIPDVGLAHSSMYAQSKVISHHAGTRALSNSDELCKSSSLSNSTTHITQSQNLNSSYNFENFSNRYLNYSQSSDENSASQNNITNTQRRSARIRDETPGSSGASSSEVALNRAGKSRDDLQEKFLKNVGRKLASGKTVRGPVIFFTIMIYFIVNLIVFLYKFAGWSQQYYSLTFVVTCIIISWLYLSYSFVFWAFDYYSYGPYYLVIAYNFFLSMTLRDYSGFMSLVIYSFLGYCVIQNALSSKLNKHLVCVTVFSIAQYVLSSLIVYFFTKSKEPGYCFSMFCFGRTIDGFRWGMRGIVICLIGTLYLFYYHFSKFVVFNSTILASRDAKMRELYMNTVQMKRKLRNFEQKAVLDLQTPLQKAITVLRDLTGQQSLLDSESLKSIETVLQQLTDSESLFKPEAIEKHSDDEMKGWLNDLLISGKNASGKRHTSAAQASTATSTNEPYFPNSNPQAVLERARRRLSIVGHIPLPPKALAIPALALSAGIKKSDESLQNIDDSNSSRSDSVSTSEKDCKNTVPPGKSPVKQPAYPDANVEEKLHTKKQTDFKSGSCSNYPLNNLRFLAEARYDGTFSAGAKSAWPIKGPITLFNMENVSEQVIPSTTIDCLDSQASKYLQDKTDSIAFSVFDFHELAKQNSLYHLVLFLGQKYGIQTLIPGLKWNKLENWLYRIEGSYHQKNPYHNSLHACDVAQAVHYFLSFDRLNKMVTAEERFAAVLAAAAHDVAHPGVNNQFLINTVHPLAVRYNDLAVLENYHASTAFEIMAHHPQCDFLVDLPFDTRKRIRELILAMILATDMGQHFEFIGKLKSKQSMNNWDWGSNADRNLALCLSIKCADISNPVRPFPVYAKWTTRVMEEFYAQGDEEKRLGLPVSMFMNREQADTPKCQNAFIEYLVSPLYQPWCDFLGAGSDCDVLENLKINHNYWTTKLQAVASTPPIPPSVPAGLFSKQDKSQPQPTLADSKVL